MKWILLFLLSSCIDTVANNINHDYTVIDNNSAVIKRSKNDIAVLFKKIAPLSLEQKINYLSRSPLIIDHPYISVGAEGESNWRGSHIQQDPIYRTDQYNCITLVSLLLALIETKTEGDFDRVIFNIEYGAAGKLKDSVHYYNRNNFISTAFNPVNEANGYLEDQTVSTADYAVKTVSTWIDVPRWFALQTQPGMIKSNVRVFDAAEGDTMVSRFLNHYPPDFPALAPHSVTMRYIPKTELVSCDAVSCKANEKKVNELPTPAVVEIVRDDHLWHVHDRPIREVIGSGIIVSHVGIIFKKIFFKGETIYQKITCQMRSQKSLCKVTPVQCDQRRCVKVMFLHATDAYPNDYYFYRDEQGYQCTDKKPQKKIVYTRCNRVIAMPLGDYLSQYEYGCYTYMNEPSILGLHFEKIINSRY